MVFRFVAIIVIRTLSTTGPTRNRKVRGISHLSILAGCIWIVGEFPFPWVFYSFTVEFACGRSYAVFDIMLPSHLVRFIQQVASIRLAFRTNYYHGGTFSNVFPYSCVIDNGNLFLRILGTT